MDAVFFPPKQAMFTQKHHTVKITVLSLAQKPKGYPLILWAITVPKITTDCQCKTQSRSLNLANTVSIVTYEGWRQLGFQ